ncbi:hypothetical protein D3C72_2205110 [compost metagenome]
MRASLSMPSFRASSTSMVDRLLRWAPMMACDKALMTKRGDTPARPSSGDLSCSRKRLTSAACRSSTSSFA